MPEGCYWDILIKKLTIQQNAGRVIWKGDPNVWHPHNCLKQLMENIKENTEKQFKKHWKPMKNNLLRAAAGIFFFM